MGRAGNLRKSFYSRACGSIVTLGAFVEAIIRCIWYIRRVFPGVHRFRIGLGRDAVVATVRRSNLFRY
jgi:hypothetical protein